MVITSVPGLHCESAQLDRGNSSVRANAHVVASHMNRKSFQVWAVTAVAPVADISHAHNKDALRKISDRQRYVASTSLLHAIEALAQCQC